MGPLTRKLGHALLVGLAVPCCGVDRFVASRNLSDPVQARFFNWLADECDAEKWFENVFHDEFDHGGRMVRGIGVNQAVEKDHDVACVAKRCRLTPEKEVYPEHLLSIFDRIGIVDQYDHLKVSLLIGEELMIGDKSFWAPYFAVLPKEEDLRKYHPAFFDLTILDSQTNYWVTWLGEAERFWKTYVEVKKELGQEPMSWANMKLAYLFSTTRSFAGAGVVPWLDFANSEASFTTEQMYEREHNETTGEEIDGVMAAFCMVANKNLQPGVEVTCNYDHAEKTPMDMFMTYGFALPVGAHVPLRDNTCTHINNAFEAGTLQKESLAGKAYVTFKDEHCTEKRASEL